MNIHPYELEWRNQYKKFIKIPFLKNLFATNLFDYVQKISNIVKNNEINRTLTAMSLLHINSSNDPVYDKFKLFPHEIQIINLYYVFASILLYKQNKYIYDFDYALTELFVNSSWKDVPADYIKLPKSDFAIFYYRQKEKDAYTAFCIERNEIGLTIFSDKDIISVFIPLLPNTTIEESFNLFLENEKQNNIKSNKQYVDFIKVIINSILYILGDKDVVKEIHPGANPKKQFAYRDPIYGKTPDVYKVGQKYRKLIERYELDGKEQRDNNGNGGTKCPHVRSAHFHSYWTGKGRTTLIVKFLMSCLINGYTKNFTDMEEDSPDITNVK